MREDKPVMVAGAHSMGALGVIRSLGRAGYPVHAVSDRPDAIGLRSKYARYVQVHPPGGSAELDDWLDDYIKANRIAMIVPGGAISPSAQPRYKALFPVPADAAVLAKSSKFELFESLTSQSGPVQAHLPPLHLIDLESADHGHLDLDALGEPLFIKLDGRHSKTGKGDQVIQVSDAETARFTLNELSRDYRKALVQGYVPGVGVGVFLLRWNGKIVAKFMHRRLHEMPHTGGASSFRESWWHEAICEDATAKLNHIGWEGVAMVEYRWDPDTDSFYLMEMNLRFWGSIHLALLAGVDFPTLLADCFFGLPIEKPPLPKTGIKCRNMIPFEIGYLVSLWRDPQVSIWRKFYSLVEAAWLTLDPRVRNDLLFPGDRGLFWWRLMLFLRTGK